MRSHPTIACSGAVVVGLLLMDVSSGVAYAAVVVTLTIVLFAALRAVSRSPHGSVVTRAGLDRQDVVVILGTFLVTVGFFRLAFTFFDDNDGVLFLNFAAGLLIGVLAPIVYTVWLRRRPLRSLGLSLGNLRATATMAILFASVQFSITLWGYDLPEAQDWITLLGMALMVGVFESIYFRGFVQGRLEESFGTAPAVFGAAFLYALYHLGYGMGAEEMTFLFGLGLVYALAYSASGSLLVLWPLLTPLGNLFAQLESGELAGRLPWAALIGFADVIAVFALAIWLARRRERKLLERASTPSDAARTHSPSDGRSGPPRGSLRAALTRGPGTNGPNGYLGAERP